MFRVIYFKSTLQSDPDFIFMLCLVGLTSGIFKYKISSQYVKSSDITSKFRHFASHKNIVFDPANNP
jgi:hypothetical protein